MLKVAKKNAALALEELLQTMAALRGPNGCKWDKAQTHETLIKNLREEAQEVIDAIAHKDDENFKEELGDLLLQVVFHAAIAQEEGRFDMAGIIEGINQKLIRRHPHVFAGAKAGTPEEALARWREIKRLEKEDKLKKG